ncbi:MAG: hypothetical protein H7281_16810 [Bacteriovorax sp.]|nr:hypothetical protein [Bacteriovorax sp.]
MDEVGNGLSEIYSSPNLQLPSTEAGFEHFVSVTFVIHEIEWLLLDRQGHRRSLSKFNEDQKNPEIQTWLYP